VKDAQLVRQEISILVERINAAYPGAVYYEEKPLLSLAARLLLWNTANVSVFKRVNSFVASLLL